MPINKAQALELEQLADKAFIANYVLGVVQNNHAESRDEVLKAERAFRDQLTFLIQD